MKKRILRLGRRVVGRGLPLLMGLTHCGPDKSERPSWVLSAHMNERETAHVGAATLRSPPTEGTPLQWHGNWLAQLEIPVRWEGTEYISPGDGHVNYTLFLQRRRCSGRLCDSITLCGVSMPPFHSKRAGAGLWKRPEWHHTYFLPAIFDGGGVPQVQALSQYSGTAAGAEMESEEFSLTLGLDPAQMTAAWPKRASGLRGVQDDDGDGRAGVTLYATHAPQDGIHAPWVSTKGRRAYAYDVVARARLQLHGRLTADNRVEGEVSVPEDAGMLAVQTRILGCIQRRDAHLGPECTEAQSSMADEYLVPYLPNGVGSFKMARLKQADSNTCANLRRTPLD